MAELSEYRHKYPEFALERTDGILHLRFHTNDGEWVWSADAHRKLSDVMHDIDADRENRVLILSATGNNWVGSINLPSFKGITWDVVTWEAKRYFRAMLDLEIPVIAAVHGNCTIHAEIPLMSDIVLASHTATFGDSAHLPRNVVPGDGTQIIWSALLGPNRSRYLLLGEKILSAQESLDAGIVAELHASEVLLDRAFEHARRIAAKPSVVARNTRTALIRPLRKAIEDSLSLGLALQGAAYGNQPHRGEVPVELDSK
jgi:enoyl-CoA hydratase/carnithine racemase